MSNMRQQLLQRYAGLDPMAQAMLQTLSVAYESITKTHLFTSMRKAGLRLKGGKALNNVALNRWLAELYEQKLATADDNRHRCHPLIVELITQQAVKKGSFGALAEAVEKTIPVRKMYWRRYPFDSYQQALREIRTSFYRHDFTAMIDNINACAESFPDSFNNHHPLTVLFNNPFDSEWVTQLPQELLVHTLVMVLDESVNTLQPHDDAFALLEDYVKTDTYTDPLKSVFVRQLLLRGRTEEAETLLADVNSPGAMALRARQLFFDGNNSASLEAFDNSLKLLRKAAGKRKVFLSGMDSIFFILALLRDGSPASLKKALTTANELQRYGSQHYSLAFQELATLIQVQQGSIKPPPKSKLPHFDAADFTSIGGFFFALTSFWLDRVTRAQLKAIAEAVAQAATTSGYLWLAAEMQALLRELKVSSNNTSTPANPEKTLHLAQLFKPKPAWEHALDALLNLGEMPVGKTSAGAAKPLRLVWWISYGKGYCSIEPREQKINAKGEWTRGRPIALKRLYESLGEFDYFTDQDRRVCSYIRQEYETSYGYYDRTVYEFNTEQALLALVGHPLLFWAESPDSQVELVKAEPELMVEQQGQQVKLYFTPQPQHQRSVCIVKETPSRLKLIEFNDAHLRVATIIGNGLTVPVSAKQRVLEALGKVAQTITVHSDIGGGVESLQSIAADPTPHLHLLPFGDGLKVELLVQPFARQGAGPYYQPGSGGATVIAEVGGKRLQARRDLVLEREQAQAVIELLPSLQRLNSLSAGEGEWTLGDPEDCLELLLELQQHKDQQGLIIEWPEGEAWRIKQQAAFSQFRLSIKRQKDWFAVDGELRLDEHQVLSLQQLLELIGDHPGRFVRLADGQFLALTKAFRQRLDEIYHFAEHDARGIRFHPLAALALEELTDGDAQVKADKQWRQYKQRLQQAQALQPELPSTLQAQLRDYQQQGFAWLARLAHWGVGACLADDMGLGKTLQALALLLTRTQTGPSLVVAPTSVCMNWQSDARRFAPTLNAILFGPGDRQATLANLGPFDLLICSYGLLQNESERLGQCAWQVVVLDEAQAIKNMTTKRSQAAMLLSGEFKMITTGTPVENHLGELWNLFRFINPGLLGSLDQFNRRFAVPIERDHDQQARNKLKKLIQPFVLRRLKSEVLEELPPRTEITLQVELGKQEQAFYEALRRRALQQLEASGDAPQGQRQVKILAEIMKLRRACCNPRLITKDTDLGSAKLDTFTELLDELLANRHKALVFSQFVDHLSIIREVLDKRAIRYQYLDGSTAVKARKQRVEAFQAGDGDVFLISLKAGGVGLNLTAADYVIHMDPWWNPAVEDQAADRAHRIGQQRPVTIYRLVTQNTIEEKIVELHQQKRDLATSLLAGSDMSGKLSADDLLQLLRAT